MHGRRGVPAGLAVTVISAILLSLTAAPARAERDLSDVPGTLTETYQTPNFLLHFTSAFGDPNGIGPQAIQQLAGNAERAYGDLLSRTGFPRAMDDGDGRIDLYVFSDKDKAERGLVRLDRPLADQNSGWIAIPPDGATDIVTVAHQVFHLMQANVYRRAGPVLLEGGATWASLHLYSSELRRLPDEAQYFPDDPLDCTDARRCTRPGRGTWQFFELLAERYGPETLRRVYDRVRAGARFRDALEQLLQAQGTTLPTAFADFTRTNLVGGYALSSLAKRRYGATEPFGDIVTGRRTRRFRPRAVLLDHLSAAFFRVRSGTEAESAGVAKCRRATLTVTVTGPLGLEAPLQMAEFRPRRRDAVSLTLNALGTAKRRIKWSTCPDREVGIAFLNPNATVDDRRFTVTTELKVAKAPTRR